MLSQRDVKRLLRNIPEEEREAARDSIYPGAPWYGCEPGGQARTVVAFWLAGRATAATESVLRARVMAQPAAVEVYESEEGQAERFVRVHLDLGGGVYWFAAGDKVMWTVAEATYAVGLLSRPDAEVVEVIRRNWERLADPRTPTDEIVGLFGLEPVPSPEELLIRSGVTPEEAQGMAQYSRGEAPPCR